MFYIAFVAAILPHRATVDRECLSAIGTGDLADRPAVNQVKVGVPPLVSAFVGAELLFLSSGVLLNKRSAAQTFVFRRIRIG